MRAPWGGIVRSRRRRLRLAAADPGILQRTSSRFWGGDLLRLNVVKVRVLAGSVVLATLLNAALAAPANTAAPPARTAAPRVHWVGGAAPYLPGEELLGALPSSTPMQVTVSLRSRDPSGLKQLATAVSTPGDPGYGHFLTVAQFAQRFGAPPGALDTVAAALQADGLSIAAIPRNDLTIEATGSSAAMARA